MTAAPASNLAHRSRRNAARARLGNQGRAPVRARSPGDAAPERHCRNMTLEERRLFYRQVDEWNEASRVGGVAPLTPSAMRTLRVMLFQCMDWITGRLDSAYSWIARLAGRAYQTAVSAVAQLEGAGLLKVQRRARRGDDPDGPRWVQDTNLYRFELPAKIAALCARLEAEREARRKARAPDDFDHARESAAREKARTAEAAAKDESVEAIDLQLRRDLAAARAARGPGAARHLAQVEARARARDLLQPPESNS